MQAAKALIELGPDYVLIKKGGNGSMLYSRDDLFLLHAYPLDTFADPTGAGDSFAGGLMGALAASENRCRSYPPSNGLWKRCSLFWC